MESYGLQFEPAGADRDALEVEDFYYKDNRGEFWTVVEDSTGKLVGTGGYYQIERGDLDQNNNSKVEIRKMYLAPSARGKKLGRTLLQVWLLYHLCSSLPSLGFCFLFRGWRNGSPLRATVK